MNYKIVKTGSSGNCLILDNGIALDMGVPFKEIQPFFKDLKLVFVSHSHSDHFRESTIRELASRRPALRFCGGPWLAEKFLKAGVSAKNIDILEEGKTYDYGRFSVSPVPLVHDVPNFGLRIFSDGQKIIYIIDTGTVDHVNAENYDLYFIEGNHLTEEINAEIAEKKANGEFAYEYRAKSTHLSQEQALDWLYQNIGPKSQYIMLHQHKG